MNIRKVTMLAAATAVVSLTHVAVAPALGTLGSFGATPPGTLNEPAGMAVDQITGDVYVADSGNNRVVKYDRTGNFILTFGKEVNETTHGNICPENPGDTCKAGVAGTGAGEFDDPQGVAVDPTTSDVYVNAGNGGFAHEDNRLARFHANGEYVSQIVGGQNGTPTFAIHADASGIAVDTEGNLYVASGGYFTKDPGVFKFNPTGQYTGQDFVLTRSPQDPQNVAVDANGTVYASTASQHSEHPAAVKFAPNGVLLAELFCKGEQQIGLAVNVFTNEVFVTGMPPRRSAVPEEFEPFVCVYDSSGHELEEFKAAQGRQELRELAYGVSAGTLYEGFERSPVVWTYGVFPTPPTGAPSVSREDWSNPGLTSMTVSERVNPHSLDTTYFFQYSASPDLSGATSVPAVPGDAGSSFLPVSESASVTGLSQSTTYYYRMVAHNAFGGGAGTTVDGPIQSFTTLAPLPSAVTGAATEAAFDSATVSGVVAPGSVGAASDTLWCFQYGTTDTPPGVYDRGFVPGAPPGDAGQGTEGVPVSVRLTRLEPATSYRYRLVAVNSLGSRLSSTACGTEGGHETDGAEGTFTTGVTGPGPLAVSGPLAALSGNAATLTGSVDPRGTRTVYDFQLGTDESYGVDLFGEAGGVNESELVSVVVSSLQPDTTYHYRLLASSRYGTSYGADESFTTPAYSGSTLSALVAPPLLATPSIAFPKEPAKVTLKTLTRSQQLSRALKACKKRGKQRSNCERTARKKYGAKSKEKK